jgi:ankyrin repeat protein
MLNINNHSLSIDIFSIRKVCLIFLVTFYTYSASAQSYNDTSYNYPLHNAVLSSNDPGPSILRHLKEGYDINSIDDSNQTPLYIAIACGNTDITKLLLKHNASTHTASGTTFPLLCAVEMQYPTIVQLLLQHGANPHAVDNNGQTALHLATQLNDSTLINLLLEHGAPINARDKQARTPLCLAAKKQYFNTMQLLLKKGGTPNIPDADNKTPLDYVTQNSKIITGTREIIQELLLAGTQITKEATRCSLKRLLDDPILIDSTLIKNDYFMHPQSPINSRCYQQMTLLECILAQGDLERMRTLFSHGASYDTITKRAQQNVLHILKSTQEAINYYTKQTPQDELFLTTSDILTRIKMQYKTMLTHLHRIRNKEIVLWGKNRQTGLLTHSSSRPPLPSELVTMIVRHLYSSTSTNP